jgi:glycosyltransferase involved in cell wall biosynthesis
MKVALVHDFLREYGGAERVVEAMHEIWPEAPLYTSFVDWKSLGRHASRFEGWDIRPSWVQHNWLVKKFHSPLRFLAPKIWESFDLSNYDVVVSSSGWFMCRGVNVGKRLETSDKRQEDTKRALHICYIHHPPRNLYGYATGSDLQKYWVVRAYATVINFFLRQYDFQTAQNVDWFIANSKETARRVKKFYRRESTVIYPPVDTNVSKRQSVKASMENTMTQRRGDTVTLGYFLSVGRLTYAKRIDLAIESCNKLKLPLKIVGKGKEETYLHSIAGPTVEFVGSVSDEELDRLYAGATALIFSALDEDFGIVPVEAMARGVPVIGLAQGGTLETVIDGKTGVLFPEPTVESLTAALKKFIGIKRDWSDKCVAHAKKFSKERFKREMQEYIASKINQGK